MRLLGSVIDDKLEQPSNACSSIDTNPSGITIDLIFEQSLKASKSILTMLFGMVDVLHPYINVFELFLIIALQFSRES